MSDQKFTLTGPNDSVINIISQNRKMLVDALDQIHKDNPSDEPYYLKLERADCKCEVTYGKKEDIPEGNHTCGHGHYFIYYTDSKPA